MVPLSTLQFSPILNHHLLDVRSRIVSAAESIFVVLLTLHTPVVRIQIPSAITNTLSGISSIIPAILEDLPYLPGTSRESLESAGQPARYDRSPGAVPRIRPRLPKLAVAPPSAHATNSSPSTLPLIECKRHPSHRLGAVWIYRRCCRSVLPAARLDGCCSVEHSPVRLLLNMPEPAAA